MAAKSVTYCGNTMTLNDAIDARSAIEQMASMHKTSMFDDSIHVGDVSTTFSMIENFCVLASAMWYQLSAKQGEGDK